MFAMDDVLDGDDPIDSADAAGADGEAAALAGAIAVRVTVATECRSCGYETDGAGPPPRRCPKCGSSSWARFARMTGAAHGGVNRRAMVRGAHKRLFDRPVHRVVGRGS
jgi:hypothetical protein